MDIKMDGNTLVFINGKFQMTDNMLESLSQRLSIRIKSVIGNWFLDINYGVDYFNRVFEKGVTITSLDALFQTEIKKDQFVDKITYFKSSVKNNVYKMEFKVRYLSGDESEKIQILVDENGQVVVTENGLAIRVK